MNSMAVERETNAEFTASGRVVELGSLILRHKVLIGFMSIVGAGLGYLYYVKTPPVFGSNCSLFVHDSSNMSQMSMQSFDNQGMTTQREQPHATLIATPMIVEKALECLVDENYELVLDEDKLPIFLSDLLPSEVGAEPRRVLPPEASDRNPRALKALPAFSSIESPAAYIIFHLTSRPSIQNNVVSHAIIHVAYTHTDPLISKVVLDCLVASYRRFLGESHTNYSVQVHDLIDKAGRQLSEHIHQTEDAYLEFRQENPLMFNGEMKVNGESKTGNIHKERMKEIETARAKVAIQSTERKAELQSIKQALTQGGSREALTLMLKTLKPESRGNEPGEKNPAEEIFEAMLELQILLLDHGGEHPKVKALEKKIELIEGFYSDTGSEKEKPAKRKKMDFLTVGHLTTGDWQTCRSGSQ
jgi:hypothetical protein